MIKKENVTYEQIKSLQHRFCGTMFGLAPFLDIYFDEKEIQYIENKMMTDKYYRLVSGKAAGVTPGKEPLRLFQCREIWLMKFLNTPDVPVGVKAFIIYYTGHWRGQLKLFYKKENGYNNFLQELWLTERWMEICR